MPCKRLSRTVAHIYNIKDCMKKQGYNARLDESLGMRKGKESTKKQSMKDRRDESRGMKHSDAKQDKKLIRSLIKKAVKKK